MCGLELASHGESVKMFGTPSIEPVKFGDIVGLECGHRIHCVCLTHWINVAPAPTCPMCRAITTWRPTLRDQQYLHHVLKRGWGMLDKSEQRAIAWAWIAVAIASLCDPLWFGFISCILTVLTPPMLWSSTFPMINALQTRITGGPPGLRVCIFVTLGLAWTLAVLVNHSARESHWDI